MQFIMFIQFRQYNIVVMVMIIIICGHITGAAIQVTTLAFNITEGSNNVV